MTDQCVRLGLALLVIVLISVSLYHFSGGTSLIEPSASAFGLR